MRARMTGRQLVIPIMLAALQLQMPAAPTEAMPTVKGTLVAGAMIIAIRRVISMPLPAIEATRRTFLAGAVSELPARTVGKRAETLGHWGALILTGVATRVSMC